ncbi:Vesicle-associated protein 2-2 [Camellia lanceoleosa]|uniref:Vesicle-associated protein 2-2 n=1 Tax=Camellia lanceoleosa TaxID=1840588 RepID=A0ACC0GUW6_9ERIC|nr:Vesicle-associated protein 2-2 [Camellia lanceoleosa]
MTGSGLIGARVVRLGERRVVRLGVEEEEEKKRKAKRWRREGDACDEEEEMKRTVVVVGFEGGGEGWSVLKVIEDVESKVENSEEVNSTKNLEYKTRKDADEPLMDVGYKTRKEVAEPTTDVEHKTRMDVDEPIIDVEHKTMNDMEELKLVKDVSEMKSKLNGLESKLSEAEVIISKLTEERRFNAQERESLRQELWSSIILSLFKDTVEIALGSNLNES